MISRMQHVRPLHRNIFAFCAHLFDRQNAWIADHKKAVRLRNMYAAFALALALGCASPETPSTTKRYQEPVSDLPSPDSPEVTEAEAPEILPETHIAAGRLHESQGRFSRAAAQYRLAIRRNPDRIQAYNRLGIVLGRMGQYQSAEEAFQQALQRVPEQAYLHNNLAFNYILQSRWPEAHAELARALELHSDFSRARVNLAMVLAQMGNFEACLHQFRLALTLPDAYYNLGLMYKSKRQPIEAAQAFMKALELNPGLAAATQRLQEMPANTLSAAQERGPLDLHTTQTASPIPVEPADEQPVAQTERPTTQPAQTKPMGDDEAGHHAPVMSPTQTPEPTASQTTETKQQAKPAVSVKQLPPVQKVAPTEKAKTPEKGASAAPATNPARTKSPTAAIEREVPKTRKPLQQTESEATPKISMAASSALKQIVPTQTPSAQAACPTTTALNDPPAIPDQVSLVIETSSDPAFLDHEFSLLAMADPQSCLVHPSWPSIDRRKATTSAPADASPAANAKAFLLHRVDQAIDFAQSLASTAHGFLRQQLAESYLVSRLASPAPHPSVAVATKNIRHVRPTVSEYPEP